MGDPLSPVNIFFLVIFSTPALAYTDHYLTHIFPSIFLKWLSNSKRLFLIPFYINVDA